MLASFWISLVVGSILGFLAGLGIGGGSLLILWLTAVVNMPYPEAKLINLLFFLPAAIISSLFRWKQAKLSWKCILPGIIGGCAAAAVFSFIGTQINLFWLKKVFGGFLMLTGLRELFYKGKK